MPAKRVDIRTRALQRSQPSETPTAIFTVLFYRGRVGVVGNEEAPEAAVGASQGRSPWVISQTGHAVGGGRGQPPWVSERATLGERAAAIGALKGTARRRSVTLPSRCRPRTWCCSVRKSPSRWTANCRRRTSSACQRGCRGRPTTLGRARPPAAPATLATSPAVRRTSRCCDRRE
jgi:hypothetical protein